MKLLLTRILRFVLVVAVFTGAYQWGRPFPEALQFPNAEYSVPESSVRFYADYTYLDDKGIRQSEQQIWSRIFSLVEGASHYMLFNFHLFNDFQSTRTELNRSLSSEFEKLITKQLEEDGHMAAILITDPINTVYNGMISLHEEALQNAGVLVIQTNLNILKDPNLVWGAIWRPFFSWAGNNTQGGWLPHPFQENGKKVTLRSWMNYLNGKSNHRNVAVIDQTEISEKKVEKRKMVTVVTSASPNDAGSMDGNVALEIRDSIWKDVVENEHRIAGLSDEDIPNASVSSVIDETGPIRVKLLTESDIRTTIMDLLSRSDRGDTLDIVMTKIADRKVVDALVDAANKGVIIRIILDPNKNELGGTRFASPNGPIAKELKSKTGSSITIRWCNTHGETCNAKYLAGKSASSTYMMVGSSNLTRRSLGGFDLEATALAISDKPFTAWTEGQKYFEKLWSNDGGGFTTDYRTFEDETLWRGWIARIVERTGWGGF